MIVKISWLLLSLSLLLNAQEEQWPSHRGPNNNYQINSITTYPTEWSVSQNKNILWKVNLPETGGGNVSVWGNKLFVSCFKKISDKKGLKAAATIAYCYDATNGKLLWQADLPGTRPNQVNGIFTDSTTPTPVTDGRHVWFFNAGGYMACFDLDGKKIWGKHFEVRTKHSAKQFQPFLYKKHIYYAAIRDKDDPKRRQQTAKEYSKNSKSGWPWMYIRRFDALTGEAAGILADGVSVHSRPALTTINGEVLIAHGKGGPHFPPEKPAGLSLSRLDNFGEKIWTIDNATLEGTHFIDDKHAYLYEKSSLKIIDLKTAKEIKEISLSEGTITRRFNEKSNSYVIDPKPFKAKRAITHRTNIGVGPYQYFMADTAGFIGRAHIGSGKVEYLQVPLQVHYQEGQKNYFWTSHKPMTSLPSGLPFAGDKRILGHGFGHVTAATPVVINNKVYFTTMLGTVYVVDALAENLDETALLAINDLGIAGKTWTLATASPAQGKIFYRTAKELICIQAQ